MTSSVDLSDNEILAVANMETTHMDYFMKKTLPEEFRRDDMETLIEECDRYFKYIKLPETKQEQSIEFMLEKELRMLYRKVDPTIKGYKEKLWMTFQRKTTTAEDVREAFGYKQTNEELEIYFETIDKLAKKIMSHEWTTEKLTEQLLVHCSNEKRLKREICLNGTKDIEGIKEKIGKLYESRSTEEEVNALD